MDHRSLPPVPIKTQPAERRGEERDKDGREWEGSGGNKSRDKTDIMRENERDSSESKYRSWTRGEAMTGKKKKKLVM